ncbi:hypothetical protein FIE12Z_11780 [Fusarium flagelliforme]|uniref:Uncharacterized protein n=1 Tax=Fusarium flagelliforme TaxID=2675880 RepID=A0A395M7V3_9HYPO|nr:hypothetical protein FIE12Z_11780 [Fusarium flagelliforme]
MMHPNNSSRGASDNRSRKFPDMSKSKKQKMEMSWRRPTDDDTGKLAQIREPPQTPAPGIAQKLEVGERKIWDWRRPGPDPMPLQEHTLKNLQKELEKRDVIADRMMWEKLRRLPLSRVQMWIYDMGRIYRNGDLLCTEKEVEEGHAVKIILKRGET